MQKNSRLMLLLVALFMVASPVQADELTVADGSQMNMYLPLYGTTCAHHTQSIYPASMLTSLQGKYITSLRYYCSQSSPQYGCTVTVSLGTTGSSSFGSDALLDDAVSTVFTGQIIPLEGGYQLVLSAPWLYEGGNLLVDMVSDGNSAVSPTLGFNKGITQSNASCYTVSSYSTYTQRQNFLPKVTIGYGTSGCGIASALRVDSIALDEAWVSWSPAVSAQWYIVNVDGSDYPVQTDTSALLEWLDIGAEHHFYVKTVCSAGDTTQSQVVAFYVPDTATAMTLPYCEGFEYGEATGLPHWWHRVDSCTWQDLVRPRVYTNSNVHGGMSSMQMGSYGCAANTVATVPLPAAANELHVTLWYYAPFTYNNPQLQVGVIDSAGTFHLAAAQPVADDGEWHYMDLHTDSLSVAGPVSFALRWESNYNLAIDDLCIEREAYCPRPLALALDSVDSANAYLHITPAAPEDAILVYVDSVLVQTVFDTVAVLENLLPGRVYHVEIRTLCPSGDMSQPLSLEVRMPCADMLALPWTEDFDDLPVGHYIPDCLTVTSRVEPDSSSYSYIYFPDVCGSQGYATDPHSGDRMMRMSLSDQQMVWVATQPIAGANRLRVSFWYMPHAYNIHTVRAGFMASPTDTASFVELFVAPICNTSGEWVWQEVEFLTETLAVALPDTACFALKMSTYQCYIDDISISSVVDCPQPTDVHTTYVGPTAATVDWTPSSADTASQSYRLLLDGEVYATALTASVCHVSGLEPDHTYTVAVQALCPDGTEGPLQSIQFSTPCVTTMLPLEEHFNENAMPYCWQVLEASGTAEWNMYPGIDTYRGHDSAGCMSFYTRNGGGNVVVTPMFIVPGTSLNIRFWSQHGYTDNGLMYVGLLHDVSEADTFTPLLTLDMADDNHYQWQENIVHATGLTPGDSLCLVFGCTVGRSDFYIDDILVEDMPTCLRPNDPGIDLVDYDSATLSWSGDTTLYEVLYGTDSTGATGTLLTATDTAATLHGLAPHTTYYAWVRARCSATDSSEWLYLGPFTTDCAPTPLPYAEDFSAYGPFDDVPCWRYYHNYDYDYDGVSDPSLGLEEAEHGAWWLTWTSPEKEDLAPGISLPYCNYDQWLVTPLLAVDSTALLAFDVVFRYKLGFEEPDTIHDDHRFGVAMSTDNAATWTLLAEWGGSSANNLLHAMHQTDNHVVLPLGCGPANVRVGFYAITDHCIIYDDWDDFQLLVDNIVVSPWSPADTVTPVDTTTVDTIPPAGILSVAAMPAMALVPNPAAGWVEVQSADEGTVEVFDLKGCLVLADGRPATTRRLDLSGLQAGTYFVRLKTASGATQRKLLVVR